MYKVSLEEVRQLCKEVITGVRIKEKDERYSDSLNFYLTNDFFFEECWNLDATLAALILPRLIHFRDNHCGAPGCLFECDENEEFDVENGIILTPTYHYLFDIGFISFDDQARIIVSDFLSKLNQKRLHIATGQETKIKLTDKRIFKMAPIHHHFEQCGWSEVKIVTVFSIVTVILCMIGFWAL